jgi:hypothetical protein
VAQRSARGSPCCRNSSTPISSARPASTSWRSGFEDCGAQFGIGVEEAKGREGLLDHLAPRRISTKYRPASISPMITIIVAFVVGANLGAIIMALCAANAVSQRQRRRGRPRFSGGRTSGYMLRFARVRVRGGRISPTWMCGLL